MTDEFIKREDESFIKETNSDVTDKPTKAQEVFKVTTTIREDYYNLAKDMGLRWSDAMEYGIHIKAGDELYIEYEDARFKNVPLYKKMRQYQQHTEDAYKKVEELEKENERLKIEIQKFKEKLQNGN